MRYRPFDFADLAALRAEATALGVELPLSGDTAILAQPFDLDGRQIPNRLLAQPIEGFDAEEDGSPSRRSIARYQQLARNGFGTLWMESISVNAEGRSNPRQLWLHKKNLGAFREMLDLVRAAAPTPPYLVAQLTHSGRYSKPRPICAFDNPRIPKEGAHIVTDEELDALVSQYVETAALAVRAGFDAVDIRACHGYLINELFSARGRPGKYGGCFENRVRLLLDIVGRLQDVPGLTLGVRLNIYDGLEYPYGWGCDQNGSMRPDPSEPLKLIELLNTHNVRLFNISSGIGAYSAYVLRPYDYGAPAPEAPLQGVARMLAFARDARKVAPSACIVASALSYLREFGANAAAGGIAQGWFDLAGFGRQSIAYPKFARDVLEGRIPERGRLCNTCGGCSALIKTRGKEVRCIQNHAERK